MAIWFKDRKLKILIGLLLLILPIFYFVYSGASVNPLNPHDHLIQNGLAYVFLTTFSYVNHTFFVPHWFLAKQYKTYLVIAICCVLGAAYLPYRIEQWVYFKPPQQNTPVAWVRQIFVEEMMLAGPADFRGRPKSGRHWFDGPPEPMEYQLSADRPSRRLDRFGKPPGTLLLPVKLLLFFLLGSVSTLISISVQTASRLRQVENNQLQAELRQLRAQIQPHFLFNTLNSIYALAIRQDDKTPDTIVKLSEFMRYTIRDAHRDKVPLANEIDYIRNYIDLQKARLRDAVTVDYQLSGAVERVQIAPLLLFSFIENAFKYGVNPEEDSLIRIHIDIHPSNLRLEVVNNKVQISQLEESTGIGIQNARQRLHLLYPNVHDLRIIETRTHFHVTLHLVLS